MRVHLKPLVPRRELQLDFGSWMRSVSSFKDFISVELQRSSTWRSLPLERNTRNRKQTSPLRIRVLLSLTEWNWVF